MKAIIVIECDEDNEVIQHISEIRKQLKKEILARRKDEQMTGLTSLMDIVVTDDNCYGSHMATVHYDDTDTSHSLLKDYTY
jgi:hypothetical protein